LCGRNRIAGCPAPVIPVHIYLGYIYFGQLASNQTYLLRLNALPIISASAAVGGTGRRGVLKVESTCRRKSRGRHLLK